MVLDVYDRYFAECLSPLQRRREVTRKLLPFARFLYGKYIPHMQCPSGVRAFDSLAHATAYFKALYPSKLPSSLIALELLERPSAEAYLEHYDGLWAAASNSRLEEAGCLL